MHDSIFLADRGLKIFCRGATQIGEFVDRDAVWVTRREGPWVLAHELCLFASATLLYAHATLERIASTDKFSTRQRKNRQQQPPQEYLLYSYKKQKQEHHSEHQQAAEEVVGAFLFRLRLTF
jgi:hypothetical protein